MPKILPEIMVTVNPLPSGTINGPDPVCTGIENEYSINLCTNCSTYLWTATGSNSTSTATTFKAIWQSSGDKTVRCTLTSSQSCTAILEKKVTVVSPPNGTSIDGDTPVCIGDEKGYSIKDCTTCGTSTGYSWTVEPSAAAEIQDEMTAKPKVIFKSGTQCTLKVTISNGSCTQMLNKVITINPLPSGTIKVNTTGGVCQNQTRTYSIDQLMNCTDCKYSWSIDPQDAGTPMNGSNSTFEVNWTKNGQHVVRCTLMNKEGCQKILPEIMVTVNPLPSGTINGPDPVCTGIENEYSINLCTNCSTYLWTATGSNSTSTATTFKAIWQSSGDKTVRCTLTSSQSCTAILEKKVTVVSPPNGTSIDGDTPVCIGDEKGYSIKDCTTCGTSTGYSWTVEPSAAAEIQDEMTAKPKVIFKSGTQCTLKVTISNGSCTQMLTKVITINPVPSGTIMPNTNAYCKGTGVTYNIQNCSICQSYNWFFDPPGTTNTITNNKIQNPKVTWNETATLKCEITSISGCKNTISIGPITVNPLPSGTINGPDPVCTKMNYTYQIDQCTNCSTYLWTATDLTSSTSSTYTANWQSSGDKTVRCTLKSSEGCEAILEKNVKVVSPPDGKIVGQTELCSGDTMKYSINDCNTCNTATTYSWTVEPSTAADIQDEMTATPKVTFKSGTQCTLTATLRNGNCEQKLTLMIKVNPLPAGIIEANTPNDICQGDFRKYSLTNLMNCSNCKYNWSLDDPDAGIIDNTTNPTILVEWKKNSDYKLKCKITNDNGCITELEREITIRTKPAKPDDVNYPDVGFCNNLAALYKQVNTPSDNIEYIWNGMTKVTNGGSMSFDGLTDGEYSVPLVRISSYGCRSDVDTMKVSLYCAPSVNFITGFDESCHNELQIRPITNEDSCNIQNDSMFIRYKNTTENYKFTAEYTTLKLEGVVDQNNKNATIGLIFGIINTKGCSDTITKQVKVKFCNTSCQLKSLENNKVICHKGLQDSITYTVEQQNINIAWNSFIIDSFVVDNTYILKSKDLDIKYDGINKKVIVKAKKAGDFNISVHYHNIEPICSGEKFAFILTGKFIAQPKLNPQKDIRQLTDCKNAAKYINIRDLIDPNLYSGGGSANDKKYSLISGTVIYPDSFLLNFDNPKYLKFDQLGLLMENGRECVNMNVDTLFVVPLALPIYKRIDSLYCANNDSTTILFTNNSHKNNQYVYDILIDQSHYSNHASPITLYWRNRDSVNYRIIVTDTTTKYQCKDTISDLLRVDRDYIREKTLDYLINGQSEANYCGDRSFTLIKLKKIPEGSAIEVQGGKNEIVRYSTDSALFWVHRLEDSITIAVKTNTECVVGSVDIPLSVSGSSQYVPYRQIVYIPSAQVLFYPFDSNYCFKWYRFGTDQAFAELVGNKQSYIIPSSEYSISKYHYYVKVSKSESCDTCATICWFNFPGLGVLGRSEEPAPGIDQQLNIYPNPSSGSFVLEMYNRATRTYDVSIRDIQGRLHFRDKWTAIPGTSTLRPEHVLGRWPSGLYLVSLSDGLHEPIIQKIVVE
ncbi:MAG: T9SS type A sorting domain-containing protein [Saprospiraceae bacterium]|nr:T9SS type A sorting domain-containing protein [Saprospiraceae bacterium]